MHIHHNTLWTFLKQREEKNSSESNVYHFNIAPKTTFEHIVEEFAALFPPQ